MDFIHQVEPYITENEIKAVTGYLKSGGWLTEFKETQEFGKTIGDFVGMKHSVVVTSGTVALYLALLALGIGKGDKVIVPNYTMIATINAVKWAGAEPLLVDVCPDNLCMDIEDIKLDPACKALIYVSINGRSGDVSEVKNYCSDNKLFLIEDACQSLGSKYDNRYLGTFGDVGVYSFTPHKIITTGQGGAVVTDEDGIHSKIKKLKDFHRTAPATDWHDGIGFNFKFTDLQAVVGIEQMKMIEFRIRRKKEIFSRYLKRLESVREIGFLPTNFKDTTPWFVDIFLSSREVRDNFATYLKEQGVGSRPFYPPISHQEIYSDTSRKYPVSESAAYKGLWLPSSIGLTDEKIDYICEKIACHFKSNG